MGLFGLWYYAYWAKVQAIANGKAAQAAKESADAAVNANRNATRALEVTERAYVNVQVVERANLEPFETARVAEALVSYKNSGLTHASAATYS
jgi:hypothetical protein